MTGRDVAGQAGRRQRHFKSLEDRFQYKRRQAEVARERCLAKDFPIILVLSSIPSNVYLQEEEWTSRVELSRSFWQINLYNCQFEISVPWEFIKWAHISRQLRRESEAAVVVAACQCSKLLANESSLGRGANGHDFQYNPPSLQQMVDKCLHNLPNWLFKKFIGQ